MLCVYVRVCQFSGKTNSFDFFSTNLPKNGFWGQNFKVWIWNQYRWDAMCTNFQTKQTTLNFWAQICPKMDIGLDSQKSKSGFGINTSNIRCVPIFSQNGQPLIFRPKFGEFAQLRAILWFKYCWGCCRE